MAFASNLFIHDVSRSLLDTFVRRPTSGLLLSGPRGVGLTTIARELARAINPDPDGSMMIAPESGKDISIDQVRQLYTLTRATRERRLVVIIDEADTMSLPAQNAFLKLLEEPPAQVSFVLVAHTPSQLLPTIHSRVSAIECRLIDAAASRQLLDTLAITDDRKREQLRFVANGLPALLTKLANDDVLWHRHIEIVTVAKSILSDPPYERLVLLRQFMTERSDAIALLEAIGSLVVYSLGRQTKEQSTAQLTCLESAINKLHDNANVRLQLLRVALCL